MRIAFARAAAVVAVAASSGISLQAQSAEPRTTSTVPAFVIESDNGDNRIQIGTLIQFDGRFTADDPEQDVIDTFAARRVRPILQGRVAKFFDYFFVLDFAGPASSLYVRDAYFETRLSNAFRVRAGKGKVPFGLERLIFANVLLFVERALPTALTPDRDLGVQILGEVAGGRLSYVAALTNGVIDGGSGDVDGDEGKDVAARIVISPWASNPAHPLAGLGVGLAATTGTAPAALPVVRSAGQQMFFSYAGATGVGRRRRLSPQGSYYRGSFGGFAEYVQSSGSVRKDSATTDVDNSAWQVAGSWVLTGERATDRGVRPRANFDPEHGTFGAIQVAVRYHVLRIDPATFAAGLAAAGASRSAESVTAGVNWYLNPFIKWVFNVERTVFDEGAVGSRHAENAILFRGQLSF